MPVGDENDASDSERHRAIMVARGGLVVALLIAVSAAGILLLVGYAVTHFNAS